jgi:hypothetical protein
MKERPILMSAPMVQAILENRKSQTRRIVKKQPETVDVEPKYEKETWGFWNGEWPSHGTVVRCPYGQTGDRLWVKEAWRVGKPNEDRIPTEIWKHLQNVNKGITVLYEAGGWKSTSPFERPEPKYRDDEPMPEWAGRKRSSMFMPRWASRITLEIMEVRVQRLQEISNEDAKAEGVDCAPHRGGTCGRKDTGIDQCAICPYRELWNTINGPKSWEENPWIWALSFRRVS